MIVLSVYLIIGVGADAVMAKCFEQNGDIYLEEVTHSIPMQGDLNDIPLTILIYDSGNPISMDPSRELHRDLRITPEGSASSKVTLDIIPRFKIQLYTIVNSAPTLSQGNVRRVKKEDTEPSNTSLDIKKTTVLLI
jgi:hypothetical protein